MKGAIDLAGQYIVFGIGSEECDIDLRSVHEIRSYKEPTQIAGVPASVRGVIVPVLDMRLHLRSSADITLGTVSIMVDVGTMTIGMVVDTVSNVVDLTREHIRLLPGIQVTVEATCLKGLGTIGGRMLQLLNVERLMALNDLHLLQAAEPLAA